MLKKLLLSFITVLIPLFIFSADFSAAQKLDFLLECDNNENSSYLQVDLYAEGSCILSAATIKITYDENAIDFSSISKQYDSFEVRSKESEGEVKSILLCSNGYSFKKRAKLLSYKFKNISGKSTNVNLSVSDVVDYKLSQVNVGNVYGCKLTFNENGNVSSADKIINKKSDKLNSQNNTKTSDKDVDKEDNSKVIIPNTVIAEEEEQAINTEKTATSPHIKTNSDMFNWKIFVIGTLIGIIIMFLFYVAYKIGINQRKSNQKIKVKVKPSNKQNNQFKSYRTKAYRKYNKRVKKRNNRKSR